jgi:biotin-dependent carboxylase-like uncharacterized protein
MILDVLDGGPLTTVQDAGRPGWTDMGVPESGAADPLGLAVANLLVGNDQAAAALEMTLAGPTLVARSPGLIGLAGADLGARIAGGRRLPGDRSHRIARGDEISFDGQASAAGARAYLAVPGGIDVPIVLGSRSTCLAGGFGGLDGRALRAGDRLAGAAHVNVAHRPRPEQVWPVSAADGRPGPPKPATLRVLPGPSSGAAELVASSWRVALAADRVGVRLDGPALPATIAGETLTLGVPWGAIQVPPDGRPIILSADHQTTGGYRVPAVVISADLPILGQLRPGDEVILVLVDNGTALAALRSRRDALVGAAATLREAAGWHALSEAAGG